MSWGRLSDRLVAQRLGRPEHTDGDLAAIRDLSKINFYRAAPPYMDRCDR